MRSNHRLPPEVARRLGPFYVYVLVDPRTGRPFYVGKGKGQRLASHGNGVDVLPEPAEPEKVRRIREIRQSGWEPRIDVVRRAIESEAHAYVIEAALIDTLPGLVNRVRGHEVELGRERLEELVRRFGAPPLCTRTRLILVRLGDWVPEPDADLARRGQGFEHGMSVRALYGSTRGWWRVSPSRLEHEGVRHAVAVYEGVTRAVFTIDGWLPKSSSGRQAFRGSAVEDGPLWEAIVGRFGRRVPAIAHAQNPIMYWPR